jgi:hypothetical protein
MNEKGFSGKDMLEMVKIAVIVIIGLIIVKALLSTTK